MIGELKNGFGDERGAALLVVLLLVATLAFVAISITQTSRVSVVRSANDRSQTEGLWVAFGAETLARTALETISGAGSEKFTRDDPRTAQPTVIPFDDGTARVAFTDNTGCFNVNSLTSGTNDKTQRVEEFTRLVAFLGLGQFEGERIANVIGDWIDENTLRDQQGAEDDFYTRQDVPYRTGGVPVSDISELRAMRDIDQSIYGRLKPVLCAHPDADPSIINVNMLQVSDAPVLATLFVKIPNKRLGLADAETIIAAYPAQGYDDINDFCAQAPLSEQACPEIIADRLSVRSKYILAQGEVAYDRTTIEMTTLFRLDENRVQFIRRRLGASE